MDVISMQLLSPNEPVVTWRIEQILDHLNQSAETLSSKVGSGRLTISVWNATLSYDKNDVVLFFKTEPRQASPEVGKREFAFILVSTKDGNISTPNYDLVDGIPDFRKSNWRLLNPLSYLLQDVLEMKKVVQEVMQNLIDEHVQNEHGLVGSKDVEKNLVKKDYSNLQTSFDLGSSSAIKSDVTMKNVLDDGFLREMKYTNGVMDIHTIYGFDAKANRQDLDSVILDDMHYLKKSPIWDESDHTIFSRKYMEDDMFSVVLKNGEAYNNLRYGTNIFFRDIEFSTPFVDDEYCVFFHTYGDGQFVFGYDKSDLMAQEEPTYDAVVSMPMILNKTSRGFTIVLPIHTHFNSLRKFNIGVPYLNQFSLQAIGRYR